MNELKNVFSNQEGKNSRSNTFHSLIYSTATTNNTKIYYLSTYNKLGLQKWNI